MTRQRFRAPKHVQPPLNIMIGVAGHIDHGKTELVKMLTGCDTDRLKEEKERGMSIELGYAPCFVGTDRVGIVDVPGHEKFVRKMVAGATGIDIALLVIAADDGVMPQTIEHLDVIELLNVNSLLVAITKTDLVSAERVEEVHNETLEFLLETSYKDAPITPVSSIAGHGLDTLRNLLSDTIRATERRKTTGAFRVPIDRVFTSPGHGVVATGIAVSGTVKTGDTLEVLPAKKPVRVRTLQVYLGDADEGLAGQCVALNLTQVRHDELERGYVIGTPNRFNSCKYFTVLLQTSRFLEKPIQNATRVHFHTGTSETPGKVRLLELDEIGAGQQTLAQVECTRPVPAFMRDRYILRIESPAATIGGGLILESGSRRYRRRDTALLGRLRNRWNASHSNKDLMLALMQEKPSKPHTVEELAILLGLETDEANDLAEEAVAAESMIRIGDKHFLTTPGFQRTCRIVFDTLSEMHRTQPARYAFNAEEIRKRTGIVDTVLSRILEDLLKENRILSSGGAYRSTEAPSVKTETAQIAERIESILLEERFQTSSTAQLAEKLGETEAAVRTALRYLIESDKVRCLTDTVYLHAEHVDWARDELVSAIKNQGSFETHKFKNVIGSSRKYAIPLLDYFDEIGLTRRVGGVRYLREEKG